MAKAPPNIPEGKVGERVRSRANHYRFGVVTSVSPRLWLTVKWDDGYPAPKICHQFELVKVDAKAKTEG